MAELVYAIDDFPGDDRLWRIEWIGGVGYNTSVPSEPLIDVSLAPRHRHQPRVPGSRDRRHVGIVNNHEPLGAPANRTSWCELQRDCH